ncbi:MAG: nicotinate (nicotinamide) nucleotide adenylyltransferase [Pseudomonadota bacterium]
MIAILGGTFDPVHNGHILIASKIYHRFGCTQLQFMPCGNPVHRIPPRASSAHRCAMIEKAISDNRDFRLNRLEVDTNKPSFSVDSIRQICRDSDSAVMLILGSDAFNGFASWKQPEKILQMANIVVCHRPGVAVDDSLYSAHRVSTDDEFLQHDSGAIYSLEVDANPCASSIIRDQVKKGIFSDHCLSPAVVDYIQQNKLYGNSVDS